MSFELFSSSLNSLIIIYFFEGVKKEVLFAFLSFGFLKSLKEEDFFGFYLYLFIKSEKAVFIDSIST